MYLLHYIPLIIHIDVVQAYKGIQKEKEALEASLKALMESRKSAADDSRTSENKSVRDFNVSSLESEDGQATLSAQVFLESFDYLSRMIIECLS